MEIYAKRNAVCYHYLFFMRNIILFIVVVFCAYMGYDKFGRRSVSPKVVAECTVQQKSFIEGKDSMFAIVAGKEHFITHVLNKSSMWVYPQKDSLVTAFVTAKNSNLQFAAGKATAEDIDKSFQGQIPRIILLFAFVGLVILIQHYQSEEDIAMPPDEQK